MKLIIFLLLILMVWRVEFKPLKRDIPIDDELKDIVKKGFGMNEKGKNVLKELAKLGYFHESITDIVKSIQTMKKEQVEGIENEFDNLNDDQKNAIIDLEDLNDEQKKIFILVKQRDQDLERFLDAIRKAERIKNSDIKMVNNKLNLNIVKENVLEFLKDIRELNEEQKSELKILVNENIISSRILAVNKFLGNLEKFENMFKLLNINKKLKNMILAHNDEIEETILNVITIQKEKFDEIKTNRNNDELVELFLIIKDLSPEKVELVNEMKNLGVFSSNIQVTIDALKNMKRKQIYSGTTSTAPRARTCANAIADRMPYAVGRLYVKNNFKEDAKKDAEEMINNIRDEFKIMLTENSWMDQKSKDAAREKAELIDNKIGYPDYTYNNTFLDDLYKDFIFDEENYLLNSLKTSKNNYQSDLSELRNKRDRKDWITGPAIVNAFYSSTNNQISFPAGILQAPFYDADFPKYLNYGGIGSVIGHEITHGFDDQGRRYDKNGVFIPDGEPGLWTDATINNYKEKAQCIVDQYSNYKAEQVGEYVRGFQTQGENIADNGGVKESFRAYVRWAKKNGPEKILPGLPYTQEQLFFINYAQVWCLKIRDQELRRRIETGVHSPGEFRVRGPTSNMDFFANAFNCKANTGNNPAKKCSVW
ncbi:unnamed protein product [Brachionus calyciflorus]|uniref:Uncharacterized protein n=1 Tax=Brachionus calyciflorus TaxID=104777 RepID=A0A814EJ93_9BILA|nr:unnamed protein product [Brachionus calyciflorus]